MQAQISRNTKNINIMQTLLGDISKEQIVKLRRASNNLGNITDKGKSQLQKDSIEARRLLNNNAAFVAATCIKSNMVKNSKVGVTGIITDVISTIGKVLPMAGGLVQLIGNI